VLVARGDDDESRWILVESAASHPFWSHDGRLLYYLPTTPTVDIRTRDGAPEPSILVKDASGRSRSMSSRCRKPSCRRSSAPRPQSSQAIQMGAPARELSRRTSGCLTCRIPFYWIPLGNTAVL
jgi:hypothetical protein